MSKWNRDEAMAEAQKMLKDARRAVVEDPPARTAAGHEWVCNGCPFRTPHLREAIEHLLYERANGETKYKPKRRMHRVAGVGSAAVVTHRPGRAAA